MINTLLNIIADYGLTADEVLLIYLTFIARDEEGHPEFFDKWYSGGGNTRLKELFESLKEKQIIHKDYNPTGYNPNDIEFNKTFIKSWLKNSGEMGKELFDAYPPFLLINGKYTTLRNIAKKWNTLEEFYFFYSTQIGHNPNKHKEVMELLQWGKDNDRINVGIAEFVISHKWDELKLLKDNPDLMPQQATTFDVYESV